MLKEKIMSVYAVLGDVLPNVDPERAAVIRQCRRNLEAVAEQAEALETVQVMARALAFCCTDCSTPAEETACHG